MLPIIHNLLKKFYNYKKKKINLLYNQILIKLNENHKIVQ